MVQRPLRNPWQRPSAEQKALWALAVVLIEEVESGLDQGWASPALRVLDQEQQEIWRAVFADDAGDGSDHALALAIEQKAPEGALFGLTRLDGKRPRLLVWSQGRENCVSVELDLSDDGELLPLAETGELDQTPKADPSPMPVIRSAEELFTE